MAVDKKKKYAICLCEPLDNNIFFHFVESDLDVESKMEFLGFVCKSWIETEKKSEISSNA